MSAVRVRVPATSANLGPGFDCAGLALDLWDDVEVAPDPTGFTTSVSGEGAGELATDHTHLVLACAVRVMTVLEATPVGLRLAAVNRIPHGRGLGSSAAAVVAGLLAGRALVPDGAARLDDVALLRLAAEIEGHPDNVAPCLLGGLTLAWDEPPVQVRRLDPHPDLRATALVPPFRLATAVARGLLPATVPHADAAANAARAALLATALTVDPTLLLAATADRLHQDYRSPAMPASVALVHRLRAGGLAATVSGAGPTVLVLHTGPPEDWAPVGWVRHALAPARTGASVETG